MLRSARACLKCDDELTNISLVYPNVSGMPQWGGLVQWYKLSKDLD
ncbi:MAG: hypothetical protein WED04_07400 [Promethearchaeati archaeon SRVP18_Atabeyarchaeia-1]